MTECKSCRKSPSKYVVLGVTRNQALTVDCRCCEAVAGQHCIYGGKNIRGFCHKCRHEAYLETLENSDAV